MIPGAPRLGTYIEHISTAVQRIARYTDDMDEVAFLGNELVQDAVVRNLEIIGEACRNIERCAPEFARANPHLPILKAYEMRNILSHQYFRVDMGLVWATVKSDLPELVQRFREGTPGVNIENPTTPPSH